MMFALVKVGTGTLTNLGINTYTGGNVINAGTLYITNDVNLGAANSGLSNANTLGNAKTRAQINEINAQATRARAAAQHLVSGSSSTNRVPTHLDLVKLGTQAAQTRARVEHDARVGVRLRLELDARRVAAVADRVGSR